MRSHSVTCHQTQVNASSLPPARPAGSSLPYPRGMEGWVDFGGWLYVYRDRLPVRRQSPIQILTWMGVLACLCGSLAQCALSLKRLSARPVFNPQTRQN